MGNSYLRGRARVDDNHSEIVRALRRAGCMVQSLAELGRGVPDLLVMRGGRTYLVEIKDGDKAASRKRLTPDELRWHDQARLHGVPVYVADCVDTALEIVGPKVAA